MFQLIYKYPYVLLRSRFWSDGALLSEMYSKLYLEKSIWYLQTYYTLWVFLDHATYWLTMYLT